MVELPKNLECIEDFALAATGLLHLPADALEAYLLENFVVDLDVMAEFSSGLLADLKHAKGYSSWPLSSPSY